MVLSPLTSCSQKGQAPASCSIPTLEGSLWPLSLWPRESCLPLPQQIVDCLNETMDSWQSRHVLAQDVSIAGRCAPSDDDCCWSLSPFFFEKGSAYPVKPACTSDMRRNFREVLLPSPVARPQSWAHSSVIRWKVGWERLVVLKTLHSNSAKIDDDVTLRPREKDGEKITAICSPASHDHQVTPTRPAPDGLQSELQIASPQNGQELVFFWNRLGVTLVMWPGYEGGTEITHSPVVDTRGQQSIVLSRWNGESYSG